MRGSFVKRFNRICVVIKLFWVVMKLRTLVHKDWRSWSLSPSSLPSCLKLWTFLLAWSTQTWMSQRTWCTRSWRSSRREWGHEREWQRDSREMDNGEWRLDKGEWVHNGSFGEESFMRRNTPTTNKLKKVFLGSFSFAKRHSCSIMSSINVPKMNTWLTCSSTSQSSLQWKSRWRDPKNRISNEYCDVSFH